MSGSVEPAEPPVEPQRESELGPPSVNDEPLGEDEAELLAAFDRRQPQGNLKWGFDDAMRRIEHPDLESSAGAAPWPGLPDDLWQRGRSARIGQRFVGDVAGVLADLMAADARVAADAAVTAVNGDRFVATWDALRFLAARVEELEAGVDPLGLEAAEWPAPVPDPSEWVDAVAGWVDGPERGNPVVVGEAGDGSLLQALGRTGRPVVGVEPRGEVAWGLLTAGGSPGGPTADVVFDEVGAYLRRIPEQCASGVVLVGCVDRLDLVGKVGLLEQSVRVTQPGGTIVILATDQVVWDQELAAPTRDLAPGRPLHPETWSILLHRAGGFDVQWHRATTGPLHALVARLPG
jgi:hypothetical protein